MSKGKKGKGRRRLLRCLFVLLLLPVLLWITANLVFSTSWGTGLVEKRISKRLGLPCEINSLRWTPWGGGEITEVVFHSPEDFPDDEEILRIDVIRIDPSWLSMMKMKKRFDRVEIEGVTGDVSRELLKFLVQQHQADQVLAASPEKEPVDPERSPPPTPKPDVETKKPTATPVVIRQNPEPAPSPEAVPVDDFQGEIVFSGVNLRITSHKDPSFEMTLNSIEGRLPLWGETRDGEISMKSLNSSKTTFIDDLKMPLLWNEGFLHVNNYKTRIAGIDMEIIAAVRLIQGLPFGAQIDFPSQQMDLTPLLGAKSPIDIRQLSAQNIVQGYLTIPSSFRGSSEASFRELSLIDRRDKSAIVFDRGKSSIQFGAGGIVATDMRAIGEEDAVLMNGFLTPAGQGAATIRIVASPGRAAVYEKRIASLDAHWTLAFQPLITEDRQYRDLRVEIQPQGAVINLGRDKEWVPLKSLRNHKPSDHRLLP